VVEEPSAEELARHGRERREAAEQRAAEVQRWHEEEHADGGGDEGERGSDG
jgi:hypothetical protein